MALYTYTHSDIFEEPHHYMYSKYRGVEFLSAYQKNRRGIWSYLRNVESTSDLLSYTDPFAMVRHNQEQLFLRLMQRLSSEIIIDGVDCSEIIKMALESGECRTQALLTAVFFDTEVHGPLSHNVVQVVEIFRRNIETKRLLFEEYSRGLRYGAGSYTNIENYALLASIFSRDLFIQQDIRLLNALLKLNDILVSKKNLLSSQSLLATSISILVECMRVRQLAEQQQVEI